MEQDKLNYPIYKTERVNRTQTRRFYPFVFTSTEKGGMAAFYNYSAGTDLCASREQSQACLSYAEMEQRRRSQRRLKLVGDNCSMDVNAEYMNASSALNEPTLYPSAYMVLTNKGYTKHYYAGTERVAARLGGGGLNAQYHVIDNDDGLQTKADMLFEQSIEQVNSRVLHENDLDCIMGSEFAKKELGHWIDGIPNQMKADVEFDYGRFNEMVNSMLTDYHNGEEEEVYFYHSDHLGGASWITDRNGKPVQHLQYLPFGEPFVDQHPAGYQERYTFTAKERDKETGYGYFGARYMDHEQMTMWLSVDPMADKYPNISPYAYCAWNPLKLVDPDGMDTAICYNSSKKNDKTMKYDRRHYSYDCSNILHYCTHGSTDHLSPYDTKEYPQETASFIEWLSSQNNSIYDIIVLHSCWVGNGEGCFAEQLSKIMPTVMIFAPSDELGVSDKCDFEEVLHNGFWNVFYGGVLVNSCGGGREDTKALQFIWEHISTKTIIEKFRQRYGLTSSPRVILSNILNNHD